MTSFGWPAPPPQPGLVPLRPLRVGELLSVAIRVAWRNFALLAPIALVLGLIESGVQLGVLAASGQLQSVARGDWARLPSQPTASEVDAFLRSFWHVMAALGASVAIGFVLTGVLVGPAAAATAEASVNPRPTARAVLDRLRGRWGVVLGTAVLSGLIQLGGFVLLIVPGILAWIYLLPAVPVAALEGGTPRSALTRGLQLSRGFRPRLFGVSLLAGLFGGIAGYIVSSLISSVSSASTFSTGTFVATTLLTAAVSAFVAPWSATVTALLYIDIRFRREGLAQALASSVRA